MKYTSTNATANFNCLQADCPDTCCKGWSMQLDDATYAKYEGTDLEDAVAYDGANKEIRVMKRDAETDYCIKFTDGKCSIHAAQGDEMLGDACNFYPRVTRKFGDEVVMTATLSCPEVTRLMLFADNPVAEVQADANRFPSTLKDYLPEELNTESAQKTHAAFLAASNADVSAEKVLKRLYSATQSLKYIPQKEWGDATAFMLKMADGKLPETTPDKADYYKLLQIFVGIVYATKKKLQPRLMETVAEMQKALGVEVDWNTLALTATDAGALDWSISKWKKNASKYDALLKKFIQSQLSFNHFPFAGIAEGIEDKGKLLIFRFAITRIALMGLDGSESEEDITRSIQSISRVLDHLGDATLTLNLFNESGWESDARICGLIEG